MMRKLLCALLLMSSAVHAADYKVYGFQRAMKAGVAPKTQWVTGGQGSTEKFTVFCADPYYLTVIMQGPQETCHLSDAGVPVLIAQRYKLGHQEGDIVAVQLLDGVIVYANGRREARWNRVYTYQSWLKWQCCYK